jgi:hypothetical protein
MVIFNTESRKKDIEECLAKFKASSDSKSAEKLLEYFKPMLSSWAGFFTNIAYPCRELYFDRFLRHYLFRGIPGSIQDRRILFINSLKSYTSEDIYGEVCLSFLEACKNSENIVYGMPEFLARRINELIKDPIVFGHRCEIGLGSGELDNRPRLKEPPILDTYEEDIKSLPQILIGDDHSGNTISLLEDIVLVKKRNDGLVGITINPDWVSGKTCGLGNVDEFKDLSPLDREVLARHYLLKQTYFEMGRDMGGLSKDQVMDRVHKAKKNLKGLLDDKRDL